MDLKYELAMRDCNSWEQTLETLTGKKPGHYDPKQAFRRSFSKLNELGLPHRVRVGRKG